MWFLGPFITGALVYLFEFAGKWLIKRQALLVVFFGAVTAAVVALYAALKLAVAAITYTVSNQWILMGLSMIIPSNFEACVTAMLTFQFAAFAYRWYLLQVGLMAKSAASMAL